MKKGLFITALLVFASVSLWAEDYPYVLRHCLVGDTIATLKQVDGPSLLSAEFELTQETNKVEVVQAIDKFTTAWYGPHWEGYASRYADDKGYCWWTCPELKEGEKEENVLDSGSGTSNHIGIIISKGNYRFTIDYTVRDASKFIIERLPSTALSTVRNKNKATKVWADNQMLIQINEKYYNAMGIRVR